MKEIEEHISKHILIHIRGYEVLLANLSEDTIEELVYCTFSVLNTGTEIVVSEAPYYQIQNIPAKHTVHLETLDGMEDGNIYYQLNSLKSGSHIFEGKLNLDTKKKSGMIKPLPVSDCPIKKIKTDKSSVVKIQEGD